MKRIFTGDTSVSISMYVALVALWVPVFVGGTNLQYHSLDSILEAATQFVLQAHSGTEKVEVRISPPDKRLQLADCGSDVNVFWPPGASDTGHTTVGIECHGLNAWKIYLRASIEVYDYVAVVSSVVSSGDVVSANNVAIELTDLSSLRDGVIREIEPLLNHRFKRRISAGRPLTMSMLSLPRLVRKGDDVIIMSSTGHLRVRMKGVSMSDGELGSMVQVRNSSSKRIIQGQVVSRGIVQVDP